MSTATLRRIRTPSFLLALPAWAWLLFFFLAPVGLVLWYSFGYKPGLFGTHANDKLSLDRYREAFDPAYFPTFTNTLQVSVIGTAVCLVIGVPFAYWLSVKVPRRWHGVLIGLVMVPFWTNFLVRTLGWRIILSPDGWLSETLQDLHLRGDPLAVLDTRLAVQIGVVYNYLPLMILPLFVAFDRIDPALREASRDLGASRWRTFTGVTLPLAWAGITAGCLLVFIPLMGDYITATVLGGAQGNMAGQLVASQFQTGQNWALGSAMAVLLMGFIAASVAAVGIVAWIGRRALARHRRLSLAVEEA